MVRSGAKEWHVAGVDWAAASRREADRGQHEGGHEPGYGTAAPKSKMVECIWDATSNGGTCPMRSKSSENVDRIKYTFHLRCKMMERI